MTFSRNPVAGLYPAYFWANLYNNPHKFMTDNTRRREAILRPAGPVINMQELLSM